MHYLIGDIHGCYQTLLGLLKRESLIGADLQWTGGDSQVWFLGDYTDRGPDGLEVIELLMRLEQEAPQSGGAVNTLLGNHDMLLLAAHHFADLEIPSFKKYGQPMTFYQIWERNGGQAKDLEGLTPSHIQWLQQRPALALAEGTLLMHADSLFYLQLGESLEDINATFEAVLASQDYGVWDVLMELFATRFSFIRGGAQAARLMLERLGGSRLVHGHTPIYGLLGCLPEQVTEALEYHDGLCVNLDHCLWNGGPGFVYTQAPKTEQA